MWKEAIYATLIYAFFIFLAYHYITDKELPLQRLLFKVAVSSGLMLFGFRYFVFRKTNRPGR